MTVMKAVALALFLSFVLVVSFGCAQREPPVVQEPAPNETGPQNQTPVVQAQPCSQGNVVQKDECFLEVARKNGDMDACRKIYSIGTVDDCYGIFASSSLDACKMVNDAGKRAECLTQNAVRLKSDQACSLIENDELRGKCLTLVVPPCMLVMDEGKRELCLALEKGNVSQCTTEGCLRGYAQNRSDEGACAMLSSQADRFSCIAVVRKDVSACKLASLAPVQDACVENASEELGSLEGCALGTAGSDYVNRCYLHFAVKNADMSVCRKAEPEERRDWCYLQFAGMTANVSSCPRVIETLNRISCYRQAAIGNRMPSLCNNLATDAWRRDCYAGSILYLESGPLASDCPDVYSDDWRNKCYLTAARFTYNSTLCGFISEGPDKTDCNDLFGQ